MAQIGRRLIWLHTFGERMVPDGQQSGRVPRGRIRCTKGIPETPDGYPTAARYIEDDETLIVGSGEFSPVPPDVWGFQVSGLQVLDSWLGYRLKEGAGRKSSRLDEIRPKGWSAEFTTELLTLLWILEETVAEYPKQEEILSQILAGELFSADEIPDVPEAMTKAPRRVVGGGFFDSLEAEKE